MNSCTFLVAARWRCGAAAGGRCGPARARRVSPVLSLARAAVPGRGIGRRGCTTVDPGGGGKDKSAVMWPDWCPLFPSLSVFSNPPGNQRCYLEAERLKLFVLMLSNRKASVSILQCYLCVCRGIEGWCVEMILSLRV